MKKKSGRKSEPKMIEGLVISVTDPMGTTFPESPTELEGD
jgi:hypothetical protein